MTSAITTTRTSAAFDLVLAVHLTDRAVPLLVGHIAQRRHDIFFEYAPSFLDTGLALSPLGLPNTPGILQEQKRIFDGLHGVFSDSLPDGWGLRLMDRALAKMGIERHAVTPVQRLQFIGPRAMGALTYVPAAEIEPSSGALDLNQLAEQSERIHEGSPEDVLPALLGAGGSPAGARPKVLIAYDATTHEMRSGANDVDPKRFQHYLVKFPTREDGMDIGAVEMAYAAMARDAGIVVPPTRLFTTENGLRCFAVERFDRDNGERRHVHTLGGLLHTSHREFACTYTEYLQATRHLTQDQSETLQAFRRMLFNVFAYNRDDHVKNFAFLMEPTGTWRLAPAYDLVYASGPNGEHSMMIGTEGARPTYRNFLEAARPAGITDAEVADMVATVASVVARWPDYAKEFGVTPDTVAKIGDALHRVRTDALDGRPPIMAKT